MPLRAWKISGAFRKQAPGKKPWATWSTVCIKMVIFAGRCFNFWQPCYDKLLVNTIIEKNWPLDLLPCQKQTDWEHEKKTQARLALWRWVEGLVKDWHFSSLQMTITPNHLYNNNYLLIFQTVRGVFIATRKLDQFRHSLWHTMLVLHI